MRSIRERANAGLVSLGLSVLMPWRYIPELASSAGYDFIRLDLEHSYLSEAEICGVLQSARIKGIPCQVRVAITDSITPLLGQEPSAIMAPHISTAEQAMNVIALCKFAPIGERGMDGATRRMRCEGMTRAEYIAYANNEQDVIIQLESEEGISNIDEILSLEGIDMVATGRADLSQALNVPGKKNDPAVLEAEELIIRKTLEHKKIPTIAVDDKERMSYLYDMGVRCFQIGKDEGLMLKAMKKNANDFRMTE